jgi:hypothetical protein
MYTFLRFLQCTENSRNQGDAELEAGAGDVFVFDVVGALDGVAG